MNSLGHSSPSFCHDPIETTAQAVEAAGFSVWEIVGEGRHEPWKHRREFREVLASRSLRVQLHAPLSDVNLGSLVPQAWTRSVETVEEALRGAAAIGVRRVTIHPGNHTPLSRGHYDALHEATRKALRRLDKTGADLGLELLLENMPTGWAFETDSLTKLLDLTKTTEFGICLDLGHAHVAKRLPEFERAARHIGNVHIHDNRGAFDEHLALDEGSVPWRRVVRALLRGGYPGTFVVESRNHASGRTSLHRLRRQLKE